MTDSTIVATIGQHAMNWMGGIVLAVTAATLIGWITYRNTNHPR